MPLRGVGLHPGRLQLSLYRGAIAGPGEFLPQLIRSTTTDPLARIEQT